MPKRKLTDRFVRTVQPAERDVLYWDELQGGLALKVTPAGARSFTVAYRHAGRLRWYHVARYPAIGLAEARDVARKIRARAALGQDPHGDKVAARKGETFADLAEAYFKAAEHRSQDQYRGHYDRHLKRHLGSRKAQTLTTGDFVDVKNRLIKAGRKGSVAPVLATAQAILSWAINEGRVEFVVNPAYGVKRPAKNKASGRALSHDELRTLWPVIEELGLPWGAIFKLMAFTGQRGDEIRHMLWEHVEGEWWTQPTNKADRVHRVYLAPTLRAILDGLVPNSGLIFPNTKGEPHDQVPTHVLAQVRKASGIPDFKPHMFRHTANTEMSRIRVRREHRSRVLNHAEGGEQAVYGHYDFDPEKKAALLKLERHLLGVLNLALVKGTEPDSNVVALR